MPPGPVAAPSGLTVLLILQGVGSGVGGGGAGDILVVAEWRIANQRLK